MSTSIRTLVRDALRIVEKDLRIERATGVVTTQIVPFGIVMLLLFGFGVDPELQVRGGERSVLAEVAPGLFWITVLLALLLVVGRAFAVEADDGSLDALLVSGVHPSSILAGKALVVAAELVVLELVVGAGAMLMFDIRIDDPLHLLLVVCSTTAALAGAGTLFLAVVAGQRGRDTLGPLLVLPAMAPVLIGATAATGDALYGSGAGGAAWTWALVAFALLYFVAGIVGAGALLEDV